MGRFLICHSFFGIDKQIHNFPKTSRRIKIYNGHCDVRYVDMWLAGSETRESEFCHCNGRLEEKSIEKANIWWCPIVRAFERDNIPEMIHFCRIERNRLWSFEFSSFRFKFCQIFWPKSKNARFVFLIFLLFIISAHIAQLYEVFKVVCGQTNKQTNEREKYKKISGNSLMMRTAASMYSMYYALVICSYWLMRYISNGLHAFDAAAHAHCTSLSALLCKWDLWTGQREWRRFPKT